MHMFSVKVIIHKTFLLFPKAFDFSVNYVIRTIVDLTNLHMYDYLTIFLGTIFGTNFSAKVYYPNLGFPLLE